MAIGDGVLGVFDCAHWDDPSTPGTIWRVNSVVDVSPSYGYGAVSTRLSKSTDYGASFVDQQALMLSQDLAGGWTVSYETPTIVYVPGDTKPWKLCVWVMYNSPAIGVGMWDHQDITKMWLAVLQATTPTGAWTGDYPKFMSGTWNDHSFGGSPTYESTALVLGEPGFMAIGSTLYMAYAATIPGPLNEGDYFTAIHLDKFGANLGTRTFLGQFFTYNDIAMMRAFLGRTFPRLANMTYLTAPNLVQQGAVTIMYATPADAAGTYLGMLAFRVIDLDNCKVLRNVWGMPMFDWFFTEGTFTCGASGYSPYSTECGVMMNRFSTSQTPNYQLVNTNIRIC